MSLRARFCATTCLWLAAGCLSRQEIGFLEADAGCDAASCPDASDEVDPRRAEIEAMLRDLADGAWQGEAQSGGVRVACRFTFQLDGSYSVSALEGATPVFLLLFMASVDGELTGQYQVNDVVDGELFGQFRDPLRSGFDLLSDLRRLALREDTLRFERRSLAADLSLVTTQVVLERQR